MPTAFLFWIFWFSYRCWYVYEIWSFPCNIFLCVWKKFDYARYLKHAPIFFLEILQATDTSFLITDVGVYLVLVLSAGEFQAVPTRIGHGNVVTWFLTNSDYNVSSNWRNVKMLCVHAGTRIVMRQAHLFKMFVITLNLKNPPSTLFSWTL